MNIVKTHGALALIAALALGGCNGNFYDDRMEGFTAELPEQVYPIDVVKGTVRLKLPARSARLSPREETSVRRLAGQALANNSVITVRRPAGSLSAEVVAAKITRLLTESGVSARNIRHATYRGTGPVNISFRRKFAVTRECGDWSGPVNETTKNRPYKDWGCSSQHNLAAQVANPEDFERPRVMTPPDAQNRLTALEKYGQRQDTNSAASSQSKAKVSEASSK